MKSIRVGKVITEEVDFISEKANVDQLLQIFSMAKDSFYFPVIDETGHMIGIISMQDVKGILHDKKLRLSATVGDICTRDVLTLTPDDNLYKAMTYFDVRGLAEIPVVESPEDQWVVGMLKRRDVVDSYNREVLKKGISERTASIKLT
jgi:CIC family chloride channel protein